MEEGFPKLRITKRALVCNFLNLLGGSLTAQGISLAVLLLTARHLGAERYGQYAASITITGSTAVLFNLGLDIWLLRNGAISSASLPTLARSVFTIKSAFGGIWFLLICTLLQFLNRERFPAGLVELSAVFVWLNGLFSTVLTLYKLSLRNGFTFFLQSLYVLTWLAATLIVILRKEQNPWVYMQARVFAIFIAVVSGYIILLKIGLLFPQMIHPPVAIHKTLKETIPYAWSEALAWILMRADTLIIALMLGDGETGIFSTAENVVNALFFIPAAAYDVFVPVLSLFLKNDLARARFLIKYGVFLFLLIGFLLTLLVLICASPLTSLLGANFQEVQKLLLILSPVPFLHSLVFGMAVFLVASGKQKQRTLIQALVAMLNVVTNALVAKPFGIKGVGIVYVFTELALLLGYFVISRDAISHLIRGKVYASAQRSCD
ncbi:oligosaccharide flippase family protein [Thermanaerothrix sp.]|uniref:oligosaccharide flippase family protein n=1 Tax=Thermanaerothrix sp. TaxID=2972675 RepID=UPI003C7B8065